jgi:hypothetical protein
MAAGSASSALPEGGADPDIAAAAGSGARLDATGAYASEGCARIASTPGIPGNGGAALHGFFASGTNGGTMAFRSTLSSGRLFFGCSTAWRGRVG